MLIIQLEIINMMKYLIIMLKQEKSWLIIKLKWHIIPLRSSGGVCWRAGGEKRRIGIMNQSFEKLQNQLEKAMGPSDGYGAV